MEEVTTLVSGNIGSVVILIVLWKSGLLKYLLDKKNGAEEAKQNDEGFHIKIAENLGGINAKLEQLPVIQGEVKRLADHVATQNGRISKVEEKLK